MQARRKPKYWFWGILFVLVIGGVLWSYRSTLTTGDIKFAVAQTGTITHERKVMATFANQEIPVTAPLAGKIQFVGADGQRFRRGETIAILQPEGAAPGMTQNAANQAIVATIGGLVFHQSDALESIMTSQNLNSMDLEKLLAETANMKTTGTTVQTGQVVGKIVNNLIPTEAFIELPSIDGLAVGKTIRLSVGDLTDSATILRKSDKPMGVVVQFSHYVDGSALKRRQDISWVYQSPTSGVLIPKSALWTQGEEQGIYLWDEGVLHFKKVNILDEDDNQVCIKDLPNGIPVVITPRDGLEGLVANVKNI